MRTRFTTLFICLLLTSAHLSTPVHASDATPTSSGQLLAVQWDGRIHISNPDGSADRLLTPEWTAGGDQYHPDWSPDGTHIAFSADAADGTRDIWLADVSTGESTMAFDCTDPCVWTDDPAFSPDGSSLAFELVSPNPEGLSDSQLMVLDLTDGRASKIWSVSQPDHTIYVPRWSPDGEQIVFELDQFVDGAIDATEVVGSSIVVLDIASGEITSLTAMDAFATYPDWSSIGDLITFTQAGTNGVDGPYELFTIAPDGTDLTNITALGPDGFQAIQPTFTPDGASIIFVKDEMWSNPVVATISLTAGTIVQTATSPVSGTHPRLSR